MLPSSLAILVFVTVLIGFGLFLAKIIEKPERGWLLYCIILGLLPFYTIGLHFFISSESFRDTHIWIFLPIGGLSGIIFIVWIGNQIVVQREISFEKGPLFYPFLFFLATNIASLLVARDIESGLVILSAWMYLFLVYIAIYNTLNEAEAIKRLVLFYIGACTFLSILGMYKFFIVKDISAGIDPFRTVKEGVQFGRFFEKNEFAFILEQVLFLSFILGANQYLSKLLRSFCLISSLIVLIALIFSGSRGSWVSISATLVFLWLIIKPGKEIKRKLVGSSVIVVLLGILCFAASPQLSERFQSIWKPEKYPERKYPLIGAYKAFIDHPIFGVGVDNYDRYYVLKYLPYDQYYKNVEKEPMVGVPTVYLRALTETGILGFIGLMWIIITIYREINRKIKSIEGESLEKAMLVGFLLGFVANLVHFFFISYVWPIPWIYFWFAIALTKVVKINKKNN